MTDGLPHNPLVSRSALAALHEAAYAWARSLTDRDAEAAADVLQQSYLVVVDGRAQFAGHSSLKTFLFGVVRRIAARHRRGRLRGLALVRRLSAEPATERDIEPDPDPAMSRAIHALPKRQRDVLELVIYADFTLEEAATVLDISVGSVRTHYHRAKQTLRDRLGAGDE